MVAVLAACSGEYEEQEQTEFGDAAQAFVLQQATSGTPRRWQGVAQSDSATHEVRGPCTDAQSTSTICYLPSSKNITVSYSNTDCGGTANVLVQDTVSEWVTAAHNALSSKGWTVSVVPPGSANIAVFCDSSLSGNAGDVFSYARAYATGSSLTLSETLPGVFATQPAYTIKIDGPALNALGTSAANDKKAAQHAVGNALQKPLGVGLNLATGFVSYPVISGAGDTNTGLFTAGELCRTQNAIVAGSVLTLSTSNNCSNN